MEELFAREGDAPYAQLRALLQQHAGAATLLLLRFRWAKGLN
jgi:hypothetical protein